MSKIKLTGDSSGYVEISAPSAAGNNTLELPTSGSKIVVSDSSDNVNVAGILTSVGGLNVGTGGTVITTTAGGNINIDSGGVYYDASNSRLLVGTNTARSNVREGTDNETPKIQFESATNDYSEAGLSVINNSSSGFAPQIWMGRSASDSIGGNALVSDGRIGSISFNAADGTNFIQGARIQADIDGTSGSGDLPTRLVFSTTADGASSPTERVRIDNIGNVTMAYQPAVNYHIAVDTGTGVRTFTSKRTRGSTGLSSVAAGNGSSHGSVGRFTAPVSGVYLFTCSGRNTPTSSNNELLSVYGSWSTGVNTLNPGNELLDTRGASIGNDGFGTTFTLYLSANDYWELDWYRPAPTVYLGSTLWDISILLIG